MLKHVEPAVQALRQRLQDLSEDLDGVREESHTLEAQTTSSEALEQAFSGNPSQTVDS